MATIASASSSTITSILGSIATVAHTAQRTVQTAASGLDMLDTYVDNARVRQADASKVAMSLFRKNLIIEAGIDQSRKEKLLHHELSSDPQLNQLFAANTKTLEALFTETQP